MIGSFFRIRDVLPQGGFLLLISIFLVTGCSLVVDFPGNCSNEFCPDGFACDSDRVQCREKCSSSSHCQGGWVCNMGSGQCVAFGEDINTDTGTSTGDDNEDASNTPGDSEIP